MKLINAWTSLSFWKGMAHVLDLGNTMMPKKSLLTDAQIDRLALEEDWKAVGSFMREAMNQYDKR